MTRRVRSVVFHIAQTILLAALVFFAIGFLGQNFRVEGSSMEPGLHDGQYVLVNKAVYQRINLDTLSRFLPFVHPGNNPERYLFHAPRRGDVVVFRFPVDPSRDFIKRIIAVPGDSIEIVNGQVSVNGQELTETYITNPALYNVEFQYVPPGQYFVLGDNRSFSYDSHSWGMVPAENIIGRAIFVYWPLSSLGSVGNHTIDLGFATLPLP